MCVPGVGNLGQITDSAGLPSCPAVSLTELVSEAVSRVPRLLAAMTTMEMSQHVTGPTNVAGPTLDLVFLTGQEAGALKVGDIDTSPLTWSDHFLLRFKLSAPFPSLQRLGTY